MCWVFSPGPPCTSTFPIRILSALDTLDKGGVSALLPSDGEEEPFGDLVCPADYGDLLPPPPTA